jgi:hypothetical protein
MNSKNIIPMFGADLRDEYNRQLRAKRTKLFLAKCCVVAAAVLLITAVAGMIATVHAPIFSAIVINVLIAGFFGWRYLTTRH